MSFVTRLPASNLPTCLAIPFGQRFKGFFAAKNTMGQPSSLPDAPGKANLWIKLSNWDIYGNRIVGYGRFLG
jgi:hypothetical protein